MFIDANTLPAGHRVTADVCILGAGAAGITLAVELADTGLQVVMLESGGLGFDRSLQELSAGQVAAEPYHPPLHLGSRRGLGGTTMVWGGRCVPFDPIDFERREYVAESGWPIRFDELLPYYQRANAFCEAGAFEYFVEGALGPAAAPMVPVSAAGSTGSRTSTSAAARCFQRPATRIRR
jgi:choline dehydrogenase-like flavoprotein